MLNVTEDRTGITVETGSFAILVESACGGQLGSLLIKDDGGEHTLTPPRRPVAAFSVTTDAGRFELASATATLSLTRPAPDYVRIAAQADLPGCGLRVTQEWEIHETGTVFNTFAIELPAGREAVLRDCELSIALTPGEIKTGWWNRFSRQMVYKRDYSSVHPYTKAAMRLPFTEAADAPELFPVVALDLGWSATRFASNHIEFLLEDGTAFDDGNPAHTRTRVWAGNGSWEMAWHFWSGGSLKLTGPRRYRNRWGFMIGRARTRRGAGADPVMRNNLLGCRMCHIKYPYAKVGADWPWVVMPIKQIAEQEPQLFEGNPGVERADEAAQAGADTVILHQFWMRNPGTNNEPPADYIADNPAWMKAFIDRCHARGMKVLPYIRGTEQWCQYTPFFEDYCRKDWDGLYADWNTPFFMGYVKASPLHLSLYSYFHFTRSLRMRVGNAGALVGHTNNANMLSLAFFDAALSGETSVRHDELLVNPEMTAYFAGIDFAGAHLISGNLPDRKAFASPTAMALCAALGMASQPALEPGKDFGACSAYMKPLWDALRSLPGTISRLHNPCYAPTRAVAAENASLFPCLWESDAHGALLVVTRIGNAEGDLSATLNLKELDLPAGARIQPLPIAGTFQGGRVSGQTVSLPGMATGSIAAFKIG